MKWVLAAAQPNNIKRFQFSPSVHAELRTIEKEHRERERVSQGRKAMTTRIAPGVGANLLGQHSAERNQDATAYVGNLDPQVLFPPFVWYLLFLLCSETRNSDKLGFFLVILLVSMLVSLLAGDRGVTLGAVCSSRPCWYVLASIFYFINCLNF